LIKAARIEAFLRPYVNRRDGDVRELVDPTGDVVAREGDFVSAGGGMNGDDSAFIVCGPFTVEPPG